MTIADAHELAKTHDCKIPNCTRVSLGAVKGPYAYLCDEHTGAAKKKRREVGIEAGHKRWSAAKPPTPPTPPAAPGATLSAAVTALARPASALEQAVAHRREASAEAKGRLADFNTALTAVRAAAEALLQ